MRSLFIINPTSGRDRSARLKRGLLDAISKIPHSDAFILTAPDEATHIAYNAVKDGYDAIIVAGGDGTINEVINGIGDSDIALGIVPLGTGNVLAFEMGISCNDVGLALSIIRAGNTRRLDLGKAGDRRFLLMAGFGFDAEVVRGIPRRAKGLFGRMAYAPTLVRESVRYRPSVFRLVLDNETAISTTAYNVIICNCSNYAPKFQISPDAKPDDGILDVLIFEHRPVMKLKFVGWLSASLITNWAANSSAVHYQARHVRIESDPTVKMQIDGDVRGESGVDVEVIPKALRLIVP